MSHYAVFARFDVAKCELSGQEIVLYTRTCISQPAIPDCGSNMENFCSLAVNTRTNHDVSE